MVLKGEGLGGRLRGGSKAGREDLSCTSPLAAGMCFSVPWLVEASLCPPPSSSHGILTVCVQPPPFYK